MRKYLYLAGGLGVAAVGLGAFGAHGLKTLLTERGSLATWETAVFYHFIHTLALFSAALHGARADISGRLVSILSKAAFCWAAGILLFSGSLYWLALGGPKWLGRVTPLGGVALIIGWIFVILAAAKSQDSGKTRR